jgi:hypothetical protein
VLRYHSQCRPFVSLQQWSNLFHHGFRSNRILTGKDNLLRNGELRDARMA